VALHGVRKSLVRRIGSDSGFTLVETMVALGILFVGLLTLAYTATIAFSDVGFARQRQGATAIANRILEEVRGLPYAAVSLGLDIDDLNGTIANGTETDVVKTDAPLTYTFRGEEIPFGDLPPIQPTNPHIASGATDPTLKLGSTVYTQKVYVTYGTGPAEGGFHVTVIVSWANPQRGGVAASVEAQTHLYASPPTSQDCSSSETHPFSAPCQPFFYGTGNVDPGIVTTTGTVEDLSFDSFQLDLIRANADAQLELVSQLQGGFRLPAGNKTVSGATTTAGGQSAISAVDNDPASPTGTYQVQPSPPSFQPAGSVSVADDGNELRISLAGSDSGSTTSAMAAGGSSPCTIQTDGRPCGYTSATQLGAVDEVLNLAEGVGSSTLVRVGAHAAPSTAYVRRVASGGGDGVLRETVVRNLPDVQLGAIPSSITPPVGWLGYWVRVTGYSATAQAEAGTNSTAPIQTISGGQVQYWNGVGYTPVGITTAGSTLAIPAFTYAKTNGSGDQITVQLTASLKIDASPATTQEFLPGSSTTRTSARAMLGSPLTGTMTVRIQRNGSEEASVTLAVKLGTVTAQASYKPAPTPS
jgi:type II secretory pathway pseudopilin PulG